MLYKFIWGTENLLFSHYFFLLWGVMLPHCTQTSQYAWLLFCLKGVCVFSVLGQQPPRRTRGQRLQKLAQLNAVTSIPVSGLGMKAWQGWHFRNCPNLYGYFYRDLGDEPTVLCDVITLLLGPKPEVMSWCHMLLVPLPIFLPLLHQTAASA